MERGCFLRGGSGAVMVRVVEESLDCGDRRLIAAKEFVSAFARERDLCMRLNTLRERADCDLVGRC